ncbi:hypothetical protein CgunFtcFv8_013762 [Champsocephalus gunnari]|uniref:Uncharacterized protein n=1 Tax=Champsocephalus gunnari TaxID=52237 RepID=A0AAN8ED80_CHAGU|nr:hypothetical protein CgunFtcFv8_013762 [Champsocephalus gunnari]
MAASLSPQGRRLSLSLANYCAPSSAHRGAGNVPRPQEDVISATERQEDNRRTACRLNTTRLRDQLGNIRPMIRKYSRTNRFARQDPH